MNTELPLYQGAMPQAAQQQFNQVPQMPRLQMYGEQLDKAIAAGLDAVDKYADLHDFGVRQETEHKLRQNELEMQQEFERKSRLAPGAEGSFFTADGNLNEDAVAVFTDKWQQRNREVARPYWKREGAMRGEEQVLAQNDRLAGNVGLGLMKMESQHRQQAFKDNYDLAVAQGDTAGACRIVDDAVASGQVTKAKGQAMKLGLARRGLRADGGSGTGGEGGGIVVNGTEYTGFSAALAAQRAKDGWGDDTSGEAGLPPGGAQEVATAGDEGKSGGGVIPEERGTLTETHVEGVAAELSPVDAFFETGDYGTVIPLMPQGDVSAFAADIMGRDYSITSVPLSDGRTEFSCTDTAPDVVQRATAHANEVGELTSVDARSMVSVVSMSTFAENPDVGVSTVLGMFAESGVYEALGDGDEEVGKARAEAIVREVQERSRTGTTKLGMQSIGRMVDAHLASGRIKVSQDPEAWRLEAMRPKTVSGGKWKRDDLYEEEYGQWLELYGEYERHRAEYRADARLDPSGEASQEEFEDVACNFYRWWKDKVYTPEARVRIKERNDAIRDWYMGEITEALLDNMTVGADGTVSYGGYASDVAVAQDVLQRVPPVDLGADSMARRRQEQEGAARARSAAFRARAEGDFQRLREGKNRTAVNREKARRAKEKSDKDAEEEGKRRNVQQMNVRRRAQRTAAWAWDGQNAEQGSIPSCTIPENEYNDLVDNLGYDGTQTVYLQIDGAKILVTGTNTNGRIELNSPAVNKLHGKRKKGDKLTTQGRMGYSYHFTTSNTK